MSNESNNIGRIAAFAFALLMFCTTEGHTQASGNDLLSDCEIFLNNVVPGSTPGSFYIADGHPEAYRCYSFVGAIQQLSILVMEGGHSLTYLCLPANSTLIQLIRIVAEYGHRHPEKLNEQAAEFTLGSLTQAFPCNK
jgi:hypothetical protein